MGAYGSGARFILEAALKKWNLELAEWVLGKGANPDAAPARDKRFPKTTLYQEAQRRGFTEMADLLLRRGAAPSAPELTDREKLVPACLRLDTDEVEMLFQKHPDFTQLPDAMFAAAEQDRADVVALLLDLGVSPDVSDAYGERPLHRAAANDALATAKVLIERGAAVDPRESRFDATPIGWASYGDRGNDRPGGRHSGRPSRSSSRRPSSAGRDRTRRDVLSRASCRLVVSMPNRHHRRTSSLLLQRFLLRRRSETPKYTRILVFRSSCISPCSVALVAPIERCDGAGSGAEQDSWSQARPAGGLAMRGVSATTRNERGRTHSRGRLDVPCLGARRMVEQGSKKTELLQIVIDGARLRRRELHLQRTHVRCVEVRRNTIEVF